MHECPAHPDLVSVPERERKGKLLSGVGRAGVSVVSGSEGRFPKSLLEFQGRFATEGACAEYLFERRWPEGFVCPGCGGGRAWLLSCSAEIPLECVDIRNAAQNHIVSGSLLACMIVPAVTEVCRPQSAHS